jgi:SH3 domain-containing YSC84-like protein 1
MKRTKQLGIVVAMAVVVHAARARADEQQNLVDKARMTLDSFTGEPGMAEMRKLMTDARAVLVVPQFLKAGFVLGGAGGSGVLRARDAQTGDWSEPAFYTIGAGSVGFQIGASASEVVLVVMTDRALDAILQNRIKLGADLSAAVGPVGAGVGVAATTNLRADVVSFTRSKGLFAGVSFEGAVLQPRAGWNRRYYGKAVTPADIVKRRLVSRRGAAPVRRAALDVAEPATPRE